MTAARSRITVSRLNRHQDLAPSSLDQVTMVEFELGMVEVLGNIAAEICQASQQ